MKKLITVVVIALLVVGAAAWLALNIRAKGKYDNVRGELADHILSAVPVDAETRALLAQIRTSWVRHHSETGGPHSVALEALGLRPSVSNLVHVFTYRLPEYSFWSIDQNKTSTLIGVVQGILLPGTIDESIHVSDDGHLAIAQVGTNFVFIFADEGTGLREETYFLEKENIEQSPAGDVLKAAPEE